MLGSEKARGIFWQIVLVLAVIGVAWYLISNTQANLAARNISVGFGFLSREAGFEIGESLIEYDSSRSYLRAFLVGLGNTLFVAAIGIVLATIIGLIVGIMRLSDNWLVSRVAAWYVEVMRNIPLLLQLLVWYGLITELLPPIRQSIRIGELLFLNQRGLRIAWPQPHPAIDAAQVALLVGVVAWLLWRRHTRKVQNRTGRQLPLLWPALLLVIGLPLVVWAIGGAPTALDIPKLVGFNFAGGKLMSPEFTALLIGLSTYTAAFIAEIVRAGILSVDSGQTEASKALGLTPSQRLRLVTLPQALRVIIPPMTSQYLNLTKNSSLGVAIGYPDLVAVANTTMNQTGQAIEAIAITMAVYLFISLAISFAMNWYNNRVRLIER
jgi:general L-amino acid transport system permease protein